MNPWLLLAILWVTLLGAAGLFFYAAFLQQRIEDEEEWASIVEFQNMLEALR